MQDQVTQNARYEDSHVWRAWEQFTEAEKAAALSALGTHLLERHPRWTREAAALAVMFGNQVQLRHQRQIESPIAWAELTPEQMAGRLVEVADWCGVPEGQKHYLRDACLDVAEDLRRTRSREGRER